MIKTIGRIMMLIQHLNLSARKFDISIGASNGYILRMNKNNASVGSDVIEKIIEVYPQVNLIWLITGKGPMLLPEYADSTEPINPSLIEDIVNQKIEAKMKEEKAALMKQILAEIDMEIESVRDKSKD